MKKKLTRQYHVYFVLTLSTTVKTEVPENSVTYFFCPYILLLSFGGLAKSETNSVREVHLSFYHSLKLVVASFNSLNKLTVA